MRIVHFSITPLAGAPIRLVRALQRHTDWDVRLIDLSESTYFDQDVLFSRTPEAAIDLAERADVIHLHNYLGLESRQFAPIDFAALTKRGVRIVRQFHSHPAFVARGGDLPIESLLDGSIPSLVIAQFQERFYPKARVVPNILPDDEAYRPGTTRDPSEVLVCTGPNYLPVSAWADRWNTKGTPETMAMLLRLQRRIDCRVRCAAGTPLAELLAYKQRAGVVLDEMVTGSYHLSGLEALSMARPVLAWLDRRCRKVLATITGSDECPFVNTRLEKAEPILKRLLTAPAYADEVGLAGRRWFERHWAAADLVGHYVRAYEQLMHDPTQLTRQGELAIQGASDRLGAIVVPDVAYRLRAAKYRVRHPFGVDGVAGMARRVGRKVRSLTHLAGATGKGAHNA